MPDTSDESLFSYLTRLAEQVKTRESELGVYPGDGPTSEQADTFLASLQPLIEPREQGFTPMELWNSFQVAVNTEMLWLLPEHDAIGKSMEAGLRELQARLGKLLDQYVPDQSAERQTYVNMAILANAAQRQVKLQSNKPVLFRFIGNVRVACQTGLASLLYSFGSALKRLSGKAGR